MSATLQLLFIIGWAWTGALFFVHIQTPKPSKLVHFSDKLVIAREAIVAVGYNRERGQIQVAWKDGNAQIELPEAEAIEVIERLRKEIEK